MPASLTAASRCARCALLRLRSASGARRHGLLGDWAASVDLVVRAATEQAPLDGIAGISEGGTVGAILFSQHLRGEVYLGSGYRGRLVLTFCALTSPAHSRNEKPPPAAFAGPAVVFVADRGPDFFAFLQYPSFALADGVYGWSRLLRQIRGPVRLACGHLDPLLREATLRTIAESLTGPGAEQ